MGPGLIPAEAISGVPLHWLATNPRRAISRWSLSASLISSVVRTLQSTKRLCVSISPCGFRLRGVHGHEVRVPRRPSHTKPTNERPIWPRALIGEVMGSFYRLVPRCADSRRAGLGHAPHCAPSQHSINERRPENRVELLPAFAFCWWCVPLTNQYV